MSDSWNLLQYQAYAQPVPLDPSEQVNPVWFPQWKQPDPEPVRPVEYRFQIPSVFFVGDEADFEVPVVVPDYGWYRPADQPLRPAEYRHRLESVFSLGEPVAEPEAVPDYGWYRPAEEPVLRPIEFRYDIPSFFGLGEPIPEPEPEVAPDYGWYRPAEEPTLPVEYRYWLQNYFAPSNWEEIISSDSGVFFEAWVQPVSQPVLPVEYRYLLPNVFVWIDEDDFVAGASPPTAHPVKVVVAVSRANNGMNMPNSGNSAGAVKTKNSLTIS